MQRITIYKLQYEVYDSPVLIDNLPVETTIF